LDLFDTIGCLDILRISVSQRCNLGLSTAATSKRFKVEGYRNKKEMKLESHTG
jgi:hypothetical protein